MSSKLPHALGVSAFLAAGLLILVYMVDSPEEAVTGDTESSPIHSDIGVTAIQHDRTPATDGIQPVESSSQVAHSQQDRPVVNTVTLVADHGYLDRTSAEIRLLARQANESLDDPAALQHFSSEIALLATDYKKHVLARVKEEMGKSEESNSD